MKGLIIKSPWIDYILDKEKIWEIRGSSTTIRGPILLIKSGTDKVYGECNLVDCIELDYIGYKNNVSKHHITQITSDILPYKRTYAWVLKDVVRYDTPKKYTKKPGAIVWVNVETF